MGRISGPQGEIEMINVINNDCNLLSYSFIANKELFPAVRKMGKIHICYSTEVITHFYVASANFIPEENQRKCLMDLNFLDLLVLFYCYLI